MLLLLIWFLWLPRFSAQSRNSSRSPARSLDAILQDYAYQAFVRPRTGIAYNGVVPSNLTGIRVSAMRLRSGSLRTRGVAMYREFRIPVGVIEQPYVERLVLVYQNLGNWSVVYYPLPDYVYLAPVLGLLAYDASNLSARNLPELDITASRMPISIQFLNVNSVPDGTVVRCVWFDLNGRVNFSDVVSGNLCSTFEQGHFSIVAESTASAPSPAPPGGAPNEIPVPRRGRRSNNSTVWIIVGSVVGGLLLLVLLGLLIPWVQRYKKRKKMQQMERASEAGEALHMTSVGTTKAPSAMVTRTQPTLETEYVP